MVLARFRFHAVALLANGAIIVPARYRGRDCRLARMDQHPSKAPGWSRKRLSLRLFPWRRLLAANLSAGS